MIHGNDPTGYDYDAADQLKANSRGLAIAIEDQSDSRSEARSGASTDFSGYFADVFDANADLASEGAVKLASALRSLAVAVGKLEEAARQEDARRQDARAWAERQQYREDHLLADAWNEVGSFIEGVGSRLGEIGSHLGWGDDPQPPDPEPEPQIQADSVHLAARDVSGGHGEGGGVSSARPENLRSFQSGIHSLDDDLATPLASLTQSLADYEAGCNSSWGTLSAQPLADSVKKWIADNGHDAEWAGTLADQFEAAGGSGGVVSLSDASLQAALERAGISVSRDDLTIGAYSAMGTPPTNGFSDDPVNTATGNFIEPECDLTGSGVASSLHLSRMYNALDDRRGVFGQGWASNLDMRLAFDQTGADFIDEDGRQIHFPRSGDSWQRAVGGNYWLTRIESLPDGAAFEQDLSLNGDGVLAVRDNAGSWWAFDRVGRLIAQGHGPGTVVSFGRDTDGRVTRLEHERGRVITIGYEDGLVASAEGCDGQRVAYRYDEANRLVAAEGTDGVRRYRWNEAGVIDRVTAADGTVECENTYDDRGRVIGQQTPFGRRVRFAYLQGGVTSVSDERGDGANTWISDRYGRVVGIVDANGNRQSMAYDRNGNLVMVTSREGKTTLHSYDGRGRRVRTVTPEGMDVTYAWDGHDRITRVTTAQGGVVEYEYVNDLERNPSIVRDPGGGVTKLDWSDGLLLRVVDPEGVSIDLDYDEYGDLIAVTNAEGDTARFERDDAGRVTRAINPLGAVTSLTYETGGDATGLTAGLTIRRREADGGVWRYEYEFGHLIRLVDPLGAVTEYGYGPGEVVSSVSDPLGRVTTGSVDEYGNVCGVRLPSGERWAFAHDGLSRLREITDPDGGVWKREYTADGLIASVCDPTGRVTTFSRDGDGVRVCDACDHASFAFDAFGRPTRRESGDGSSALTAYDVCGRPVELVDGEGGLTRVGYDLAGRVTLVTSPAGRTTRWEYDRCGRPSARIEPDGARTTLHYDRASRLVGVVGPTGEGVSYEYDAVGRVVRQSVPGLGTARYAYDRAGRLVRARDSLYGVRRFEWDDAGQLTAVTNALGGVTRLRYDAAGRIEASTDPLGAVTKRTYTALGRVASRTDPLGRTVLMSYDAAGRSVSRTGPDGRVTSWAYDGAGNLTDTSVDSRVVRRVTRDNVSRSVTVTDTTGELPVTETLRFDRLARPIAHECGGRVTRWSYDADGLRTSMRDQDGCVTDYEWNRSGRLALLRHSAFGRIRYTYDAAGRLVGAVASGEQDGDGGTDGMHGDIRQRWLWRAGFVVGHEVERDGRCERTSVRRDADGHVVRVSGTDGDVSYTYDRAFGLTGSRGGGHELSWSYDRAGRITSCERDGMRTACSYDAAGQLTGVEGPGERVRLSYDDEGRRVLAAGSGATLRLSWDALGRVDGVGGSRVQYGALGLPAMLGSLPVSWDVAGMPPSPTAAGGMPVCRAPGFLGAGSGFEPVGWRDARATDALDPFASPPAMPLVPPPHARMADSPPLAGGLSLTADGSLSLAGMEWMGARVFDSATRSFLSADPLAAPVGAAWASNPYGYAGNNPLSLSDPMGLAPITDQELNAYADSLNGPLARVAGAVGNWVANNWEYLAAGVIAGVGIALMFTGIGGPAGVALMAVSGALVSGGFSIASQKALNRDHRVDWGQVGVDAFVGLVGGAAGGGAALGLARGATALGVSSGALTSRLGSGLSGSAMRNALSGGVEGSVSNTLDYALDGDAEHDVGGFAANAGIGFATGGVGSAGGGKLGDAGGEVFQRFGVREKFVPVGRHVHMPQHGDAPKSWGRYGGELAGDGAVGAVAGFGNEILRPDGHEGDTDDEMQYWEGRLKKSGWAAGQGFASGSPGYDAGLHRAPGW